MRCENFFLQKLVSRTTADVGNFNSKNNVINTILLQKKKKNTNIY